MNQYIIVIDSKKNILKKKLDYDSNLNDLDYQEKNYSTILKVKIVELYRNKAQSGWEYPSCDVFFEIFDPIHECFSERFNIDKWELSNFSLNHDSYGRWQKRPKVTDKNGKSIEIPGYFEKFEAYESVLTKIFVRFQFIATFSDVDHYEKYSSSINKITVASESIERQSKYSLISEFIRVIADKFKFEHKFFRKRENRLFDSLSFSLFGNHGTGKTTFIDALSDFLNQTGITQTNKAVVLNPTELSFENDRFKKFSFLNNFFNSYLSQLIHIDLRLFDSEDLSILFNELSNHIGKEGFFVVFECPKESLSQFWPQYPNIFKSFSFSFDFPDIEEEKIIELILLRLKNSGYSNENFEKSKMLSVISDKKTKLGTLTDNLYSIDLLVKDIINEDIRSKKGVDPIGIDQLTLINFSSLPSFRS